MPGNRILPPVIFAGAIVLMVLLHLLVPGPQWPTGPSRSVGALLLFAGIVLNVYCAKLFEDRGTSIKPYEESSKLVVEGPYRFSRNPMYLGMLSILGGIGLLLGSTVPFVVIPVFALVITHRFILVEEAMLARRFGAAYASYCRRVRRWL
jgi:protein-S-isoprenylcysteine O-methyltransferase Ste14